MAVLLVSLPMYLRFFTPVFVCCFAAFLSLTLLNAQIVINEFVSSNSTTLLDADGDSGDWIELYNTGSESVNLAGYGITDDLSQPFRWVFPDVSVGAGGYLIVWASGKDRAGTLHTNFSISADGEPLQLTRPGGAVEDYVDEVPLPGNVAYGRVPDGGAGWFYFDQPTPGAANSTTAWLEPLADPVLTHAPGFYDAPIQVGASSQESGVVLRYTLNGDVPDVNSPVFTSPVLMSSRDGDPDFFAKIATGSRGNSYWDWSGPPAEPVFKINVLRVRAFREGHLASHVVSASYLVGENIASRYSLPVVSIQTDFDSFFSPSTGLFIPNNYLNRGIEWEREAHFEFFEKGELGFAQDVGVRIHGGFSRRAPLKSLRIYARGRYGDSVINYPVFPDKENQVFERLILRSGGSDWALLPLRDGLAQSLVRENTSVSTQYYRPVILFINGEYWGILNIRDRYDPEYLEHEYGVTGVDILAASNEVVEGSSEHFLQVYSYVSANNMLSPLQLAWVRDRVDLEDFRDYHIGQIYIMNIDQHARNIDYWRSQNVIPGHPYADGRWRWLLYDVDNSFGFNPNYSPPSRSGLVFFSGLNNIDSTSVNPKSSSPSWADNHPSETMMLRKLLKNPQFRVDFINRFADLLNTNLASDYAVQRADDFRDEVFPYVPEHLKRWKIDRWGQPDDISAWLAHFDRARSFARDRTSYMREDIRSFFNLEGASSITLNVAEDVPRGYIRINSIGIRSETAGVPEQPYPWSGTYFRGVPVTVRAIPNPGYRFAGWQEYPETSSDQLEVTVEDGMTFTAQFEYAPAPELLHYWNFNEEQNLVQPDYTLDGGSLSVETAAGSEWLAGDKQGFTGENASGDDGAGTHLRINNPIGSLVTLTLPTTGYEQPVLRYETRRSGQGAGVQYLSYSIDGSTFVPLETIHPSPDGPQLYTFALSHIDGAANNPDFAIRIAFDLGTGGEEGNNRFDNITLEAVSMTEEADPEFRFGYVMIDDHIETGDLMGRLYVDLLPWVYSYRMEKWIFMPNPEVDFKENGGGWFYRPR